ncbi:unnamed protein product [Notodromas monacha]|uniref:Peptidase M12B domain-containing protein n=1 Tax=Notodromas monacha TaxID=399045 RepID=A0A7R9BZC3_9CRUS|nr:unnamed protein product [Notodromas monacha]CAG0923119.1 unnamed protein product [Notodromas monacha]
MKVILIVLFCLMQNLGSESVVIDCSWPVIVKERFPTFEKRSKRFAEEGSGFSEENPEEGSGFQESIFVDTSGEIVQPKLGISGEKFVEALLVADYSMVRHFAGDDLETYLMTVMNMDEFTSDDGSADSLLKSFCKWQHLRNTEDDSDPLHHDIAILNVTCNTLGLAEVGSLCESASSCNINEDSGLTLAYTIAHEIAHK